MLNHHIVKDAGLAMLNLQALQRRRERLSQPIAR